MDVTYTLSFDQFEALLIAAATLNGIAESDRFTPNMKAIAAERARLALDAAHSCKPIPTTNRNAA